MHVIQPQQDLFRELLDGMHRDTLFLMSLHQTEEILTEELKDHADVGAIRAFMFKVIEECEGGFGVSGGLDNFESDVSVHLRCHGGV